MFSLITSVLWVLCLLRKCDRFMRAERFRSKHLLGLKAINKPIVMLFYSNCVARLYFISPVGLRGHEEVSLSNVAGPW